METTIDPNTNEPFLKPVEVQLFGENDDGAIVLPGYFRNAYNAAEKFTDLLAKRLQSAGFLKTFLLRRLGSSIGAGRLTAEKMLASWEHLEALENEEDDEDIEQKEMKPIKTKNRSLTAEERLLLEKSIKELAEHEEKDPKYQFLHHYLINYGWLERGCIVFSQYYDTIWWVANKLTNDLPEEPIAL